MRKPKKLRLNLKNLKIKQNKNMENQNYKKKLEELIKESDLSENEKGLWALFLAIAPPEEDEAIFEAVSESDENLNMLTEHLRGKIFSMRDISRDSWDRLMANREKFAGFIESLC